MKKTILCMLALSLAFSLGCGKREDKVVATVADRQITVGAFEKASEAMEEKYLPATNDLAGKKELLDHMINKEVMALKALSAGYEKEEWFAPFWDRFKAQYLVASMQNEYVIKPVTVTDQEAADYFQKMHKQYTLSQILLPNEDEARAVREQLVGGGDFMELAKKYSMSPEGVDGGYLGDNQIGSMFYWIEEALFDAKEGDITQPLQTPTGWSILQIHNIKDITPERDLAYAAKKVRADKEKKRLEELKHKIEKEIGLVIYPDAVDMVYQALPPEINPEDLMSGKITRDNAPKLEIGEQYLDMTLAEYADGRYTLKDYLEIFDQIGLPERPTHRMGKQAVIESIHRKIFDNALAVYAEQKLKLLEVPEIGRGLQAKKEQFLTFRLYEDQVKTGLDVSDEDVRAYYTAHEKEILTQERRDFSIVLTGEKGKADEVAELAKKGESFSKLALKYSEDPNVKDNLGRTGMVPEGHFPDYDAVVFALDEGAVSDPFQVPRGWAVVKVEQIAAPTTVSYENAAESIKKALMEEKADKLLKEKLETWRKDFAIKINERNLRKADLKRTRPAIPQGELMPQQPAQ